VDFSEASLPKPLAHLYRYWQAKRGDRLMPSRTDINPSEMQAFLPHTMLIDVVFDAQRGTRFRLRLVGTYVVDGYGVEVTGKYLDELDLGEQRDKLIEACLHSVKRKKPAYRSGELRHHITNENIHYERLGLPLSSDGETVNILLIGSLLQRVPG